MTNSIIYYLIIDIFSFIGIIYSFVILKKRNNDCSITYFKIVFGTILLFISSYLVGFITLFLIIYFLAKSGLAVDFSKIIGIIFTLLFYYSAYWFSKKIK